MSSSVVDFLCQPTAYAEPRSDVELIETHISWVFLTDRFAYKLKKPVRFEFLDFSGLVQRERACRDELRLNRRLTDGVYLDVLPITRNDRAQLEIGGAGEVVDWVVKMQRLPAQRSMDRLIAASNLHESDVSELATRLTRFYSSATAMRQDPAAWTKQFEQHIRANLSELEDSAYPFDKWMIRRVHSAQLCFLHLARRTFADRMREGRVVDGHGDLRPEHVYFVEVPQIIDCIEFSPEFRTVDIADELAFLWMECDRLDTGWAGERIWNEYTAATGDAAASSLLAFYKAYRACVRCKVAALRSKQQSPKDRDRSLDDCRRYLELAADYTEALGPPVLLLVRGLSGSGKSTIAKELANRLGCEHLQTDAIRKEAQRSDESAGFNQGQYSETNRRHVYDTMFHRAEEQLSRQLSVVLDGTFLPADLREQALTVAKKFGARSLMVHCDVSPELAMQRIRDRQASGGGLSDARPEFVQQQSLTEEPDQEHWPVCRVDTSQEVAVGIATVFDCLAELYE